MTSYQRPEQKWGGDSESENEGDAPFPYKIDTTWMIPIEIKTPSKSNFLFKAGNRQYTLDGTSKNGNPSELSLRKKYA
jgi:hypothetical protein